MSVFGLNTFSAMRTPVAALEQVTTSVLTPPTTPGLRIHSSSRPSTISSGSAAGVVISVPPERTYMKLMTMVSVASATSTLHVIGWNKDAAGIWRPQPLSSWTQTHNSLSTNIGGPLYYGVGTFTKLAGDAKNYDVNGGVVVSGFLLLDVCGCELIEVVLGGSGIGNAHVFAGFI